MGIQKEGFETVIINNNPETVSTDFDIADKLYFEPLTAEDVESIVDFEKPDGAVVQFGGQTAIKLTEALMKMGVPILGTKAEDVDAAEDRELFDEILEQTQIPRAKGQTVFTVDEALKAANELGYPVLVRPSYVLGGQGMQIAVSDEDVVEFMNIINRIKQDHQSLLISTLWVRKSKLMLYAMVRIFSFLVSWSILREPVSTQETVFQYIQLSLYHLRL